MAEGFDKVVISLVVYDEKKSDDFDQKDYINGILHDKVNEYYENYSKSFPEFKNVVFEIELVTDITFV